MKKTRLVSTLLAILLFLGMILVTMVTVESNPQPTVLSVNPPAYTASSLGEIFEIDIRVSDVQNLRDFEFKLAYDNALLSVQGWRVRAESSIVDKYGSYLKISALGSWLVSGDGVLATIAFKAKDDGYASCILDLYGTTLKNLSGDLIPHNVEDGVYNFNVRSFAVTTDESTYLPGQNVSVYGNLTLGASPPYELIALEMDTPLDNPIVLRTLKGGPDPPLQTVSIVNVYTCNTNGVPKEDFKRSPSQVGDYLYVNVTVVNTGATTKNVIIAVNAYDNEMHSVGWNYVSKQVSPGLGLPPQYSLLSIILPPFASLGNAIVYASVFSDLPRNGGTPYSLERSDTFQIVNSTGGTGGSLASQIAATNSVNGTFNLTFRLSPNAGPGLYRMYLTTFYGGVTVSRYAVFGIYTIVVPTHYLTIQEAVNAATTTNNSILVLPGAYNEDVTITKSLELVGRDQSTVIINGSGTGTVIVEDANNVEVSKFTINSGGSPSSSGIHLTNSSSSTLIENIVASNEEYGIKLDSSNNAEVYSNVLSNNGYGIYLNHSSASRLRSNKMAGNKYNFGVFGDSISEFTHDIDSSNTVNGKLVYYWLNQNNKTVPSDAGFVALIGSARITMRDLSLEEEGQGLLLAFTTDCLIERVETSNNDYGIYLFSSYGNVIIGSRLSRNTVGVYQSSSSQNTIFHNNFINNTNQVTTSQSSNTWDDGGRGNYWSDYTGVDSNGDGIGDTPYVIDASNIDQYPFMNPVNPIHDIAVTDVTISLPYGGTHAYPGWQITVNVIIANKGDYTESSTVTALNNTDVIEDKVFSGLTAQNETSLTFTWNTAGIPYGNYTTSAYAEPVTGETETSDNTHLNGWVLITLMGDVDGDRDVDVGDQRKVQLAMFTVPGDPYWNPYADVDGDLDVDVGDQRKQQLYMFEWW